MTTYFGVLGPVEVHTDAGAIDIRGAKRRSLLVRLLVSANQRVPIERLADDIWEGAPGAGAASTLASHVSLLRQLLGWSASPTISAAIRSPSGPANWTSTCSRRPSPRAGAIEHGDLRQAIDRIEGALGHWRGHRSPTWPGRSGHRARSSASRSSLRRRGGIARRPPRGRTAPGGRGPGGGRGHRPAPARAALGDAHAGALPERPPGGCAARLPSGCAPSSVASSASSPRQSSPARSRHHPPQSGPGRAACGPLLAGTGADRSRQASRGDRPAPGRGSVGDRDRALHRPGRVDRPLGQHDRRGVGRSAPRSLRAAPRLTRTPPRAPRSRPWATVSWPCSRAPRRPWPPLRPCSRRSTARTGAHGSRSDCGSGSQPARSAWTRATTSAMRWPRRRASAPWQKPARSWWPPRSAPWPGGGSRLAFADLGPLELRGFPEPVPSLRLEWEPLVDEVTVIPLPEQLRAPQRVFVGRSAEQTQLARLFAEAGRGERQVVLLAGEPGIGKTTLTSVVARTVEAAGGPCSTAAASKRSALRTSRSSRHSGTTSSTLRPSSSRPTPPSSVASSPGWSPTSPAGCPTFLRRPPPTQSPSATSLSGRRSGSWPAGSPAPRPARARRPPLGRRGHAPAPAPPRRGHPGGTPHGARYLPFDRDH